MMVCDFSKSLSYYCIERREVKDEQRHRFLMARDFEGLFLQKLN
jgi:hypothetical protein